MTTTSKAEPTRRRSKSGRSEAIQLTREIIQAHEREQAIKDYREIMDNITDAEMQVVGHLIIGHYTTKGLVKEIRRLLGESIAKCKVIPFPSLSPSKEEREIQREIERRLALADSKKVPSLAIVPKRKQARVNRGVKVTKSSINKGSTSDLDQKMEGCLDHSIH